MSKPYPCGFPKREATFEPAAAVIHSQVAKHQEEIDSLDVDLRLELVDRATQAVVDSVTHELLKSPRRFAARRLAA